MVVYMASNARLALVTGAGSGIGRASAFALGKRGFALAVIDLDEGSARETASRIPGLRVPTCCDSVLPKPFCPR